MLDKIAPTTVPQQGHAGGVRAGLDLEPRAQQVEHADDEPDHGDLARMLDVIGTSAIRSVFQPIVDLRSNAVVAYEALARGPEGPWHNPGALFSTARRLGLLAELDGECRAAALRGAVEHGLVAPLMVFVNVEPEVLDCASDRDLLSIADSAPGQLQVVVEITERALASRPAELLRTVERFRELGWGVALDDVGAEPASLTFLALLRPEVIKLDLNLVQGRPDSATAKVMNAVNAYAERSGALVLAEGIETERHLDNARALGAVLGQGWLFGRPTVSPQLPDDPGEGLVLPRAVAPTTANLPGSPFAALPETTVLTRSPKRLLVEVSKQLEREAMRIGGTCVVASTFQRDAHFTDVTAQRYRDLADRVGFTCVMGEGLDRGPLPGIRGADLAPGDPVRDEWDVVVLSPHFSAALLARDLHDTDGGTGDDLDRTFEYALTYDRDVVTRAAHELLLRVAPRPRELLAPPKPVGPRSIADPGGHVPAGATRAGAALSSTEDGGGIFGDASGELLHRALSASGSGLSIVDMTAPDQPVIFANAAFLRLAGYPAEQLLGRNCRFLQGPDTDPATVTRIRKAITAGDEVRETVLNGRGPSGTPWWNELHLSPVYDDTGRVVQYIGVQTDVTARVEAEQALVRESDRAQSYLDRITDLAYTDALTGLSNRRRFETAVEAELANARATGRAVALLFMDLDEFKPVNDTYGHAVGDQILIQIAHRLNTRVRNSDLLARFGGDEFVIALGDLPRDGAASTAGRVAAELAALVEEPLTVGATRVQVIASIGLSTFPHDAADFGALLHHADRRMYERKHPTGRDDGRPRAAADSADSGPLASGGST